MKLQITPLDTVFFRDGRPFSMGEESFAEGIFPPLPSTVRGSLRSHWISSQLENKDLGILIKDSASVRLNFFSLGISGKPVFPAPFDLFFPEGVTDDTTFTRAASAMEVISKSNLPASSCPEEVTSIFLARANGKTSSVSNYLIGLDEFKRYLEGGGTDKIELRPLGDYLLKEHKIGIGRSNELHRTNEGQLFRLIANRFSDGFGKKEALSMLVDVEVGGKHASAFSSLSALTMGGERRAVISNQHSFELPASVKIKNAELLFKVYLATPAPLEDWHPTKILQKNFQGVTLIAAAVGKPISIGGWDLDLMKPKPMRKAIPPGSTYLFKAGSQDQIGKIIQTYHGKSICPVPFDLDGLGICFIAQPFENQRI